MNKISCIYMRGGTSKGPFFDLRDLPSDAESLSKVLLRIMGSPDQKQIDGLGGSAFVTSKVVMVQPSSKPGIDVDYLFAQVFIKEAIVDTKPTCGNMMSGVGPFAIEKGWVEAKGEQTSVQVYNINTESYAEMVVQTSNGQVNYTQGDLKIDGVPGTAAPILMKMSGIEGGTTKKLFPTGNLRDNIQGVELTMFDAGNLMIHMWAKDFGLDGSETNAALQNKSGLMDKLESIRLEVALKAGMGDVSNSVLPKIGLLLPPQKEGHIKSMYFTPKTLHPTHAVSGAVCVTAAALCEGTLASEVIRKPDGKSKQIILEHPVGTIPVDLEVVGSGLDYKIISAGTYRTARKIMEGFVYY